MSPYTITLFVAMIIAAARADTTVSWGTHQMRKSTTGPDNTLPSFFFMAGGEEGGSLYKGFGYTGGDVWGGAHASPFEVPVLECDDDLYNHTSPDLRVPQLPWNVQNDWGCERVDTDVPVVVAESDTLRADIVNQWGGKVWSLYHKKYKRELFYNNPAHQPANIGYRKAWSSGGCEWNWAPGKIGHSVFTESPVWTATLDTELGPVVRVWEYDRQNHTVWQVDVLIDGDVMWAHPKITNPNPVDLQGYWWTCVAMHQTPRTRIVTPAKTSVTPCAPWPNGWWNGRNVTFRGPDGTDAPGGPACSWDADGGRGNCAWQTDSSYLGNIPSSHDFFFRIFKPQKPYIAHVDEDGFTVMHAHPLNGTKFFQWGENDYGNFQQDFLSASDYENANCTKPYYDSGCSAYKHEGQYTELQIGPAPTQMHTFPVPASSTREWTEWFKAMDPAVTNATRMHSPNYDEPLAAMEEWRAGPDGMPQSRIDAVDALLKKLADVPPKPENILAEGMPWGGLREMLRGGGLAPGAPFPPPKYEARTRAWLDLHANGTFSAETLALTPITFEVDAKWVALLEASLAAGHETWLHYLFLGTYNLEAGNAALGKEQFERSMKLHPHPTTARNLALLAPTLEAAMGLYQQAWELWKGIDVDADPSAALLGKDVSGEMSTWLLLNNQWDALRALMADLEGPTANPTAVKLGYAGKDRPLHCKAALAMHDGDHEACIAVLTSHCFPTYGSARSVLIAMWGEAMMARAVEANGGKPLTVLEAVHYRREIGCDGDATGSSWKSPCIRGPPNLGYAY